MTPSRLLFPLLLLCALLAGLGSLPARASSTASALQAAMTAARPRAPSARKSPACGSLSPPPPKAR